MPYTILDTGQETKQKQTKYPCAFRANILMRRWITYTESKLMI